MKFKIPIPDFSDSEFVGTKATATTKKGKKKVQAKQVDAIELVVDMISDLNIEPMSVITAIVSIIIILFFYGNVTSSLLNNTASGIAGVLFLIASLALYMKSSKK